jgi:hypothetical protein
MVSVGASLRLAANDLSSCAVTGPIRLPLEE